MSDDGIVRCRAWFQDKQTRVEAVWPANVRTSRQFTSLKQIINVGQDQGISVQKHNFMILCQVPYINLCKGDAELWSPQQPQIIYANV